ncbi:MAG: hypothetical protein AB7T14_07895 [Candidatus Methylacidiphilaceae bacterium]
MTLFRRRLTFLFPKSRGRHFALRIGLVGTLLATASTLFPSAVAQPIAPPASARPTPAQQRQIQEMQERLRKMTREQDAELERLIAEMNGASRDKKIDLLTRIVIRLVEQRKAFHQESEAVRLKILDMQNPPAPLPRRTAPVAPPPPSVEKQDSSQPTENQLPASEQGYLPRDREGE